MRQKGGFQRCQCQHKFEPLWSDSSDPVCGKCRCKLGSEESVAERERKRGREEEREGDMQQAKRNKSPATFQPAARCHGTPIRSFLLAHLRPSRQLFLCRYTQSTIARCPPPLRDQASRFIGRLSHDPFNCKPIGTADHSFPLLFPPLIFSLILT